jgi:hypothetical protein
MKSFTAIYPCHTLSNVPQLLVLITAVQFLSCQQPNAFSGMKLNLKKYFFLVPVACITLHAFLMNGYYYQSRQLTVGTYLSSIFAKVDPSLYKNSIYIQAVNRTNLRLSLFYDLCPLIMRHVDFETFALVQSLISLFFVIAGIFMLTRVLFESTAGGYLAALLYTTKLNEWTIGSPAPFLNFFHHGLPYTYPLIIWSLVCFFKKNHVLAFLLAGMSWNFHPMTTVFLLFTYAYCWLFQWRELRLRTIMQCLAVFIVTASPVIIRALFYSASSDYASPLWLTGVKWCLYFTNFPSTWLIPWVGKAALFFILFIGTLWMVPRRHLREIVLVIMSVIILCFIGTVFSDIYPMRFIIKMSLWRSTVIYLFVALPCIGYTLAELFKRSLGEKLLALCIIAILTGYVTITPFYLLPLLLLLFIALYSGRFERLLRTLRNNISILSFCLIAISIVACQLQAPQTYFVIFLILTLLFLAAVAKGEKSPALKARTWVFPVLYLLLFDCLVLFAKGGADIYYRGKLRGITDPWADMQFYAQKHSAKDDLFLVPPYMNDFTTYSKRAVVGDWAEGSTLIYLDRQFTEEWFARMGDLNCKPYKWFYSFNMITTVDVVKAAHKYGAKYVISEKPKTFNLEKRYENSRFILYLVPLSEKPHLVTPKDGTGSAPKKTD